MTLDVCDGPRDGLIIKQKQSWWGFIEDSIPNSEPEQ